MPSTSSNGLCGAVIAHQAFSSFARPETSTRGLWSGFVFILQNLPRQQQKHDDDRADMPIKGRKMLPFIALFHFVPVSYVTRLKMFVVDDSTKESLARIQQY